MAGKFDPYYKWFGIRPEDQPPDFYRLLGIAPFETDLDVISNAADQRMNHLRTLQNGPHAVASQQVLNQVSKARVTLLDDDRKLAYDLALRKKIAAAAAEARDASASSLAAASTKRGGRGISNGNSNIEPLANISDDESLDLLGAGDLDAAIGKAPAAAAAASLSRDPRGDLGSRASIWISAAFGGLVALILVFFVLGKFADVDPLGLFPPTKGVAEDDGQGPDAPSTKPRADVPDATSEGDGEPKATTPTPDVRGTAGERSPVPANTVPANGDAANGTQNGESVEPPREADERPVNPFKNFPRHVSLPPITESTPQKLVAWAGSPAATVDELTLIPDAAALDAGQILDIVASESTQPPRWQVRLLEKGEPDDRDGGSGPTAIVLADVWIDGAAIQFQWRASAAAAPHAAQLQNCLLRLRAAGQAASLALRAPAVRPALVLDLSTPASLVEIPLDAAPKAEALVLEIGPIDALPWEARFENDRHRAAFQSPTREKIVVSLAALDEENRPELSIEPQALRTGLHLRITPRIVNAQGNYSLSLSHVAETKKNYGVRKIRIDKQWTQLQRGMVDMRRQKENIEKQLLTLPPQRALLQRELGRVVAQLAEAQTNFDKADADKSQIDELLDTMPAVEELITELHKKAKLPFRLFAIIASPQGESVEIEIVRATE